MEHLEIVPKENFLPTQVATDTRLSNPKTKDDIAKRGLGPLPLIEEDPLLELLNQATNEELSTLVEILCKKGGLTCQLDATASFRNSHPHHKAYVRDITAEIQKFGANTLVSQIFRNGKGVAYQEIVSDVASKFGIKSSGKSTKHIEQDIVAKFLHDAYEKMSPDQKKEMLLSLRISDRKLFLAPGGTEAMRIAIQHSGFAAYKGSVIVANAAAHQVLGHGLSFATNAALTKGISIFAGPIGLIFAAFLGCNAFAAPASRVTVPIVLQVAAIRAVHEYERETAWHRLVLFISRHQMICFILIASMIWLLVKLCHLK
jgi:uncharacterized protein YaaW (UPF0174 family)